MQNALRIVIADDNYEFAKFIKTILEKDERFKIIGIATSDEEEIKLIQNHKPDIVITDLKKAGKYTSIKIIEKFSNKKCKPIFFVISGSATDYLKELIDLKVKYYLSKPLNIKNLLDKINEIYYEIL